MTKTDALALPSPGSKPLKNAKYERYCRLRALAQPRIAAYREVGWQTKDDKDVYSNACALERRSQIRDRIAYLVRQAEERLIEKRMRIEEQLWAIANGNIADFYETYETVQRDHTGQPMSELKRNEITGEMESALSLEKRVRPKLLCDLSPEQAKLIEELKPDGRGRLIPKLHSAPQANKELRNMLNISAKETPSDVTQLSDAELIKTLAEQARELNVSIDLTRYTFAQVSPATEADGTETDGGQ
jgi:hypothetical protein